MKQNNLLFSFFIAVAMFSITIPNIFSKTFNNENEKKEVASYDMKTRYDAQVYVRQMETYDVDLLWSDLHWIFVYEGDITNPTKSIWMTKTNYDNHRGSYSDNIYNNEIIKNIKQYSNLDIASVYVTNKSKFNVGVVASIKQIDNITNHNNLAELKISKDGGVSYDNKIKLVSLLKNTKELFLIKPMTTKYVNNSNNTVNVIGKLKLLFTKSL